MRHPLGLIMLLLGTLAAVPVGLLAAIGKRMVMPPTVGARERDSRTVIVGGGFS